MYQGGKRPAEEDIEVEEAEFDADADADADGDGDDDVDDSKSGPPRPRGRRKISIEFISEKGRRHITFSKRKAGIMKKAYELSTLTGTQVLLLVASETGHVYTFATPKLLPIISAPEGRSLIQECLSHTDIRSVDPKMSERSGGTIKLPEKSSSVNSSSSSTASSSTANSKSESKPDREPPTPSFPEVSSNPYLSSSSYPMPSSSGIPFGYPDQYPPPMGMGPIPYGLPPGMPSYPFGIPLMPQQSPAYSQGVPFLHPASSIPPFSQDFSEANPFSSYYQGGMFDPNQPNSMPFPLQQARLHANFHSYPGNPTSKSEPHMSHQL